MIFEIRVGQDTPFIGETFGEIFRLELRQLGYRRYGFVSRSTHDVLTSACEGRYVRVGSRTAGGDVSLFLQCPHWEGGWGEWRFFFVSPVIISYNLEFVALMLCFDVILWCYTLMLTLYLIVILSHRLWVMICFILFAVRSVYCLIFLCNYWKSGLNNHLRWLHFKK